jgi:hypothetical protein
LSGGFMGSVVKKRRKKISKHKQEDAEEDAGRRK